MSSQIFRDISLERLSSPDELDRLLKVTDSKAWMSQLALIALLGMALAWGFLGRLPSVVMGQGVVIRKGGVLNIVSAGSGVLDEIHVEVGNNIRAHQILGRVAQPAMMERLKGAQEALAEAQREMVRSHAMLESERKLAIDTIARKRANAERESTHLEAQAALANEQVLALDTLFKDGIVTKQKTIEARQNVAAIEDQIASFQAQIKELNAAEYFAESKVLQRNLNAAKSELDIAENVVSPYDGEVLEIKVSRGATVGVGEPLLSIQPEVQDLQVLVYVPAEQAKNVITGMDVKISPSTVKPEEFGFIKGKVTYASGFPDTPAELMRNFENEVLVKALTQAGPVTELHVEMEKNPKTPSGYQWSSPKGPSVTISGGTLCKAEIITRWQAPITLVLPFLKNTLGLT
jgi:HlyD family secretion protein